MLTAANKSHIIFAKKCNKRTNLLISSVITDILFLSSPCDQMLIKCAFSCVVCRNVLLLLKLLSNVQLLIYGRIEDKS